MMSSIFYFALMFYVLIFVIFYFDAAIFFHHVFASFPSLLRNISPFGAAATKSLFLPFDTETFQRARLFSCPHS